MIRNVNKALKAQAHADRDIWEAPYLVGGDRMKKDAKKAYNRAQRRLNKALIREQNDG